MEFEHKKKFEQVQWTKLEKLVTFLSILMQIMHKSGYNPAPELLISYQSLYQSEYAVSNEYNQPNSMKWSKTSFWLFLPYIMLIMHNQLTMHDPKPFKCWKTFCTTIIWNIKSIPSTIFDKMTNNLDFYFFSKKKDLWQPGGNP